MNEIRDVRESMRVLPAFLQPIITWMTGKPLHEQKPLFKGNAFTQTAPALVLLFGAPLANMVLLKNSPLLGSMFLPLCWMGVVGAARKIQVTLVHQCSHGNYSGNRRVDLAMAQLLSTFVWVDHFDSYYREHILIHHTKHLSSKEDPDCAFLLKLGFRPGMSKTDLWRRLWITTVSPRFHALFFFARMKSNFISAPLYRRMMSFIYSGALLLAVAKYELWTAFALTWLLPLFPLYHCAALLNFSSLHFWLKDPTGDENAKDRMCSLTAGRFLGEAAPEHSTDPIKNVFNWTRWSLRMLFVHLPCRVSVLSGDLPVHDYHHRHPRCKEWANFIYNRQFDINKKYPGYNTPYAENWGLFNCIDAVFESLSRSSAQVSTTEKQDPILMVENNKSVFSQI
ncbi:MAG: fatty acid desaturase [Bdellovibrionota bacterium]